MNLNLEIAKIIIDELIKSNCELFCISPGFRSAPLVTAIAMHPKARTVICHDERSLCFFALGYAKATRSAAVVVVTSGTAVANLFPAIVESCMDKTPLILLTADRPAEYRGSEANQTIDQVKIFGSYVRFFLDVFSKERLEEQINNAIKYSLEPIPGPVQVNCQFREPVL